ncbi:16S rRNA (uracil(1498)-N(3))-methyltransferase [bacterium]|nr:16S rRNA (uracil(1498)-N(3))-methyltransferase [bacterium]
MPANRYFSPQELCVGSAITLEAVEALHLKTVMRNEVGDSVEIVNGKGVLGYATIEEISKKSVVLKIVHAEYFPKPRDCILGIGLLVQERLDLLLEKGCELGLTKICLIRMQNTTKGGFTDGQIDRMHRVLIASLKQSGRFWLPQIDLVPSLEDFLQEDVCIYFGDIDPSSPPFFEVFDLKSPFKLLIGPAKGFTLEEVHLLKQRKNATGVYLSDAILRAETAAILFLGLANHAFLLK